MENLTISQNIKYNEKDEKLRENVTEKTEKRSAANDNYNMQ